MQLGVIGALGVTLPFLGALALASVDFGDDLISGDVTLTTFLGGVRNGDAQNLHTGLRLSLSEYFWFEKPGWGIQVRGTALYQYFSAITDTKNDPSRASHLLQFEVMGLFRMDYVGLGMVVGPEVFVQSAYYGPPYRWNLGPVLAFHYSQPSKDRNVLFLINWRPLASLGDLNMELSIDVGALSIGGYFGWMFRDRIDKPSATTLERFISSGGLTIGARIPW